MSNNADKSIERFENRSTVDLVITLGLILFAQLLARRTQSGQPAAVVLQRTVDPNTSPWWELDALPRIGPSVAQAIIDYRRTNRRTKSAASYVAVFQCADDLQDVRGIGPRTIKRIRPYVRVAAAPGD